MAGPAPTEQERLTAKPDKVVEFVPNRDEELRKSVAGPSFTKEQATPPAAQPIPGTGNHIKAGINAEPAFDVEDVRDRAEKIVGHGISSMSTALGSEEPFHMGSASNNNALDIARKKSIKERLGDFLHRKKAP